MNTDGTDFSPACFATELDRVRRELGFEGWLLNFELPFSTTSIRDRVATFIRELKTLGSELIWYDSVLWSGQLSYQDGLTVDNKPYLDLAEDGFFTNYGWNADKLRRSQKTAKEGHVSSRIFVGVDCFGRGCPGGGGWSTHTALDLILDAMLESPHLPLSVALFAPGWPFEQCDLSDCANSPLAAFARISEADERFWAPLAELLPRIRAVAYGCKELHRPTVCCDGLPNYMVASGHGQILHTLCCTGQWLIGHEGQPTSSMRRQQIIPTCRDCSEQLTHRCFTVNQFACRSPLHQGPGTCLQFRPLESPDATATHCYIELFIFAPSTALLSRESTVRLAVARLDDLESVTSSNSLDLDLFLDYFPEPREASHLAAPLRQTLSCAKATTSDQTDRPGSWTILTFQLASLFDPSTTCIELVRLGLIWRPISDPCSFLLGLVEVRDPVRGEASDKLC